MRKLYFFIGGGLPPFSPQTARPDAAGAAAVATLPTVLSNQASTPAAAIAQATALDVVLPEVACGYVRERAWPVPDWSSAAPAAKCVDAALLQDAMDYAESNGGGSGIVVRDGRKIGEWGSQTSNYKSASSAKVGTVMVGAVLARGDGLFTDDTEARPINPDVPAGITMRQLLTMTGGLPGSGTTNRSCPQTRPAGEWNYSNCSMNYAADTIGVIVGEALSSYLRARCYDPIGALGVSWVSGYGAVGMRWSVSDAARLGLLLCRGGEWNGSRLISSREIADSTSVRNPAAPHNFPSDYIYEGHEPPTFYGDGCWLNNGPVIDGVPADLVVAMGAFGCNDEFFLAWSPSQDIVVCRAGDSLRPGSGCDGLHFEGNDEFLRRVFAAVKGEGIDG